MEVFVSRPWGAHKDAAEHCPKGEKIGSSEDMTAAVNEERMDISRILAELKAEREAIERAIDALRRLRKRKSRRRRPLRFTAQQPGPRRRGPRTRKGFLGSKSRRAKEPSQLLTETAVH